MAPSGVAIRDRTAAASRPGGAPNSRRYSRLNWDGLSYPIGNPARAAAAIVRAVEADDPPLRLLLEAAALKVAYGRLDALRADFDAWQETRLSADFPQPLA